MKSSLIRFSLGLVLLLFVARSPAQGTFQNLDFENGTFIPIQTNPFFVEPGPALPGWTAHVGTNLAQYVLHNTLSLSTAGVAIWGPDQPQPGLFHGQYYVVLQSGDDPFGGPTRVGARLTQTGTIPGTAQSIRFYFAFGGITVFFGGQQISLTALGSAPTGTIYGGDISAFAGQTGELRFQGGGYLDFIQFSNEPIPEPSTLGLFAFGALFLGWRWRKARKS